MNAVQLACYAFLAGLTLGGAIGTAMEIAAGRQLSFAEPFVARGRPFRSLAAAAAAGPFMLANDALDALRHGEASILMVSSCAVTSALWALATGIVVLGLVSRVVALIS